MIVRNRPDSIIQVEVVLERRVVSSPAYNVIRRKLTFGFEHLTNIFVENNPFFLLILKPRSRVLKVPRVR